MKRLLFATSNKHKLAELSLVLRECGVEVEAVNAPKLELQSESLEGIAVLAASVAYTYTGEPVAVEDAGLFIDALRGFPGPYSSYVYKTIGVDGILKLLNGVDAVRRGARFVSVIAYAGPWGVKVFRGEARGSIAFRARGTQGFGFDPIFIPEGSDKTFAEMSVEEKNRFSHRAKAALQLCQWLASRA